MALLARVADRLYWGARYLERAEDTARIIRAYHELVIDFPGDVMLRWEPLAAISGNVVAFEFADVSAGAARWWMVLSPGDVDVCDDDPGDEPVARLETSLRTLTEVWRGDRTWASAVGDRSMRVHASGDVAIAAAHALVQRGPYAIVRHPIYLGLLVAQLGMILALGEVRALIFVYGIDRLMKKLPLEEAALRKEYPLDYEQYSNRVRKLVPFVW